ncbi:MAG TPA: hypothetical protein VE934_09990 [Polaromonas sp.]|uniref:hypothetical protein n=1 Tax=Polaromonas sp. TaxID=1869339 RepID=UPI002D6617F8|nr:hypothetical protein [Polaromonas sp.]HYW57282.1 hypothetical protein [Polaromonas sp.]
MFFLTRAYQHVLLREARESPELFIPLEDYSSANAMKADVLDWFSNDHGQGLPVLNELVKLLLLPAFFLFWFWRRARKPPGWLVNFQNQTFIPIAQNGQVQLQGSDLLGVHLYEQKIEITHPAKGPLITLHKFSRIGDENDLAALNQLSERLATRLRFRVVGQRASLLPAGYEVLFIVLKMFVALSLLAALVFHAEI